MTATSESTHHADPASRTWTEEQLSTASSQGEEEKAYSSDMFPTNNVTDAQLAEERKVAPSGPPGGPVPDGGLEAWLQVLGAWMLFFNTWGMLNTFGVFQTYYESGALFHETSSNISWIGTVQAVMLMTVGMVAGPVFDRGYLRSLLISGSFLIVFGFMMLSLCKTFWECILAQGFCVGIGGGLLFVPAVAIMPTYFSSKLGLTIGIAASGSSTGGIIYPIMFYKLNGELGFGWATRILGFTALATLMIPIAVMRIRVKPAKPRAIIDPAAFTNLPFMTFVLAAFFGFLSLYVGLLYISYFGQNTQITDASLSFYLVPILNAASVFGRTLPNYVSDKIGPLNVLAPGAAIMGIVLLCYQAVYDVPGIILATIFFGFFSGVYVALPPVCFVALTPDKTKVGTWMGMGFAMAAAGVLAGGPAAGAILGTNDSDLDWKGCWIYGGVGGLVSAVILGVVRIMRSGPKLKAKA